jgi:hypothetical protein
LLVFDCRNCYFLMLFVAFEWASFKLRETNEAPGCKWR